MISALFFLRSHSESLKYINNEHKNNFKEITSIFHLKENTCNIRFEDIIELLYKYKNEESSFKDNRLFIEVLFNEETTEENDVLTKTFYFIKLRLMLESYLILKYKKEMKENIRKVNSNQTSMFLKNFTPEVFKTEKKCKLEDKEYYFLNSINRLTATNFHLNIIRESELSLINLQVENKLFYELWDLVEKELNVKNEIELIKKASYELYGTGTERE